MRHPRLGLLALVLVTVGLVPASSALAAAADPVTLEGQITCSQCWFEADRAKVAYGNDGDLACARRCDGAGVPAALAVRSDEDGSFALYVLDGPPPDSESWLDRMGRFVRATGVTAAGDGETSLRVASMESLDGSPWPAPSDEDPATDPDALVWTDVSGRPFALADLRGQVVVLNFWATWCAPCVKEMPELVEIQDEYALYGVRVVGAAADPPSETDGVVRFARSKKLNFPIVLGADTAQMRALGLGVALPATVVLDRGGRVVERIDGVFKRRELEAAIDRALEGGDHHEDHGDAGGDHVHVAKARPGEASLVPS